MNETQLSPDDLTEIEVKAKAELWGSLLRFTQVFYKLRTGRDFNLSHPTGRESHHITISRAFTSAFRGDITRLLINVAPGSGKSELCVHFVAWALSQYPDSNFGYISYSHHLAASHTQDIKAIIELPYYYRTFGVRISEDSSAKDFFRTNAGGTVFAAGSTGSITGFNAGLPITDRFSGALIMDDMHKPDEVFSDGPRESVKLNFKRTISQRARSPRVPFIFIGQRLHEDDLPSNLINGFDGYNWHKIILKSKDDTGNILYPEIHSGEFLEIKRKHEPYEYAAQYQQDPLPAGGGIFIEEDFALLDKDPEILATFITSDTAETDKTYNDKTVFSLFGLYKIVQNNIETDLYGLHWIDCVELSIEPKDLESEFWQFYASAMRYRIKPGIAAIEKKSTGVTLVSVLKQTQGLKIIEIDRTVASKCKSQRFLDCQHFISKRMISLPRFGKHTRMCIDHMKKITLNNSHRWDDIADTLEMAIKLALIDKTIQPLNQEITDNEAKICKALVGKINKLSSLKQQRGW